MFKNRAPKGLMLAWAAVPRIAGGQNMAYGRSLQRYLKHFGLARANGSALAFSDWITLVQDCAGGACL
jgi:hypothetical protein